MDSLNLGRRWGVEYRMGRAQPITKYGVALSALTAEDHAYLSKRNWTAVLLPLGSGALVALVIGAVLTRFQFRLHTNLLWSLCSGAAVTVLLWQSNRRERKGEKRNEREARVQCDPGERIEQKARAFFSDFPEYMRDSGFKEWMDHQDVAQFEEEKAECDQRLDQIGAEIDAFKGQTTEELACEADRSMRKTWLAVSHRHSPEEIQLRAAHHLQLIARLPEGVAKKQLTYAQQLIEGAYPKINWTLFHRDRKLQPRRMHRKTRARVQTGRPQPKRRPSRSSGCALYRSPDLEYSDQTRRLELQILNGRKLKLDIPLNCIDYDTVWFEHYFDPASDRHLLCPMPADLAMATIPYPTGYTRLKKIKAVIPPEQREKPRCVGRLQAIIKAKRAVREAQGKEQPLKFKGEIYTITQGWDLPYSGRETLVKLEVSEGSEHELWIPTNCIDGDRIRFEQWYDPRTKRDLLLPLPLMRTCPIAKVNGDFETVGKKTTTVKGADGKKYSIVCPNRSSAEALALFRMGPYTQPVTFRIPEAAIRDKEVTLVLVDDNTFNFCRPN